MNYKKLKIRYLIEIFFIIFLNLLFFSIIISLSYFYFSGKRKISEIEKYTINYSTSLIEAYTNSSEFAYKTHKYSKLRSLFRKKNSKINIDEAFFVIPNGKIISHSSKKKQKKVRNNIFNDEFTYNTDLIFLPIKRKTRKTIVSEYYIMHKKIPFRRNVRKFLKEYIYGKIDIVGWLITKAVYVQGKPVGTVNLIINKDKIYNYLTNHISITKKISIILSAISFFISLILSLILFFKYRKLIKTTSKIEKLNTNEGLVNNEKIRKLEVTPVKKSESDKKIKKVIIEKSNKPDVPLSYDEMTLINTKKIIKDAIPIINRKISK